MLSMFLTPNINPSKELQSSFLPSSIPPLITHESRKKKGLKSDKELYKRFAFHQQANSYLAPHNQETKFVLIENSKSLDFQLKQS